MDRKIETLIEEFRAEVFYLEDDELLEVKFADSISRFTNQDLLREIFVNLKSSVAKNVVLSMPTLIKTISFDELLACLISIQDDELAMYYYCQFLAEYFGIDVYGLAKMQSEISPSGKSNIMRSYGEGAVHPTELSMEVLEDYDIVQDELIRRMSDEGAPIIKK